MMQTFPPILTTRPAGPWTGLVRDLALVLVSGALFSLMAVTTVNTMPQRPWIIALLALPVLCMVASLRRLQQSAWGIAGAGLLLILTMSHPLMLYAISSEPVALGAVAALALAATAVLDILQRPDAEARIHLGLFLAPLAVVPGGWPILLVLAFLSPLTEPRARGEVQVAVALLLVALVPAIIVVFAAFALQLAVPAGAAATFLHGILSTFALRSSFDATVLKTLTVTSLPLIAFILLAMREQANRTTAAAVLTFPMLVAAVQGTFEIDLAPWTASLLAPVLVFLWSGGRRLSAALRIVLCVALAVSAVIAWQFDPLWSGSSWRERQMGRSSELLSQTCTRIGVCPASLLRPTLPFS
jgi:hypothetical protein